jgi:SH3 domain-containing YSC84-like protein 1
MVVSLLLETFASVAMGELNRGAFLRWVPVRNNQSFETIEAAKSYRSNVINRSYRTKLSYESCRNIINLSSTIDQPIKGAYMKNKFLLAILMLACAMPVLAQDKETDRLDAAGNVMREIIHNSNGIPPDLLNKADCVVIYPSVKKAAFIVGASYGRGAITCRKGKNFNLAGWSAPAMFALEGGSFGLQIGAQATDFVLLVMNESGARSVMSSKVKLGGDASIAAGPVGRTASAATDIVLKAQILSYSRSQGVFAGISLEGSTMRSDDGANKNLYGKDLSATDIVRLGKVPAPPAAKSLLAVLTKASPKHVGQQ